jgi:UDP-4-amino-4,6-dideoxy-N-acetyl-beta-L-altrosamine transaminase
MSSIPYASQDLNQADIDSVVAVLRSEFLTQGATVPLFEKTVSDYAHALYTVAVSSATSALHISCLALGVGRGDHVWTTPISFVATANCALYCGASVDFVDIDPQTYNLSVPLLKKRLAEAEAHGGLPKVVVLVHLCGQPCQLAEVHALSVRYGFKIIEDASHAIGGKYRGEPLGNCRYSDITIFSFHPVKIITTGEGGMAVTNSPELAHSLRLLRSHGVTNLQADMRQRPAHEIWNYQQILLGFNYRMTDIHAALGVSQMARLDEFVARRRALAFRYTELLSDLPLMTPWQHPDGESSWHLYVVRLDLHEIDRSHRQVYDALRELGIEVNLHYIPIYLQPYYEKLGFKRGYCPQAEQYFSQALSLPMYSKLSDHQQTRVVAALRKVLRQ